jgi:hypothetical protein
MLMLIIGVELNIDRTVETKLKVLRSISASVTVDDGGIVRVLVILTGTRMAAQAVPTRSRFRGFSDGDAPSSKADRHHPRG